VTLSLAGLGWLDETEIATIPGAQAVGDHVTNGPGPDATAVASERRNGDSNGRLPPEDRLTQDQARALKQLAQTAFGYAEGERRLRHDLGFEPDERLTLRHLCAHVTAEQYQALMETYQAQLQQQADADVP
jgi:hypothetical protein